MCHFTKVGTLSVIQYWSKLPLQLNNSQLTIEGSPYNQLPLVQYFVQSFLLLRLFKETKKHIHDSTHQFAAIPLKQSFVL